ncbi:MAG TPA: hypothetical protein VF768_11635 [Holophagaceae bacterium]
MESPDAGLFYELRMRLRGQLARHHWALGKPFTKSQQEAWELLNEVDAMARLLRRVEGQLEPADHSEFAYQVRHTVLMHFPAYQAKKQSSS